MKMYKKSFKRLLSYFLILSLITTVFVSFSSSYAADNNAIVAGFYPNQKFYVLQPDNIQFQNLTHLIYCFAWPRADGSIATDSGSYHNPSLVQKAHAQGKKFIVMMGGGSQEQSGAFPTMASNAASRKTFIDNMISWFKTYGYDGVNIDWEFPQTEADKTNLTTLIKEMRAAFDQQEQHYEISIDIHGSPYYAQFDDYAAYADCIDWFGVMVYDFSGDWPFSIHASHNAPLYPMPDTLETRYGCIDTFMKYLRDTIKLPSNKLVMGVPFYGRQFYNENLYDTPKEGGGGITYIDIKPMIGNGWTRNWDDQCKVPYLTKDGSTGVISYDDEQSLTEKCNYIKTNGYGGAMIWEITQDYLKDSNQSPLLQTIGSNLIGQVVSTPPVSATSTPTNTPTPSQGQLCSISGNILPDYTFDPSVSGQLKSGFKVELEGTSYFALTDSNGYFEIKNIPATMSSNKLKISKAFYLYREINLPSITTNINISPVIDMWAGDIIEDAAINMMDIMELAKSYNATQGSSLYKDSCDINKDSSINMQDVMIIAKHFNMVSVNYPVIPLTPNTPTVTPTPPQGVSTNVASGKTITASDSIFANPAFVTDGDKTSENYIGVTENLQWLQIDLGQSYNINKVNLWHYFSDSRTYHDVIVRLSNDPNFATGVTTVFNNDSDNSSGFGIGSDAEYAESATGKTLNFNAANARYVRLYSKGSSVNTYNHYVEVEVWGTESQIVSATPTATPPPVSTTPTATKPSGTTTPTPTIIPGGNDLPQVFFDDFTVYQTSSDPAIFEQWAEVADRTGGPGPGGCQWKKENITFVADPSNSSNKLMRLTSTTNGLGDQTVQAEIMAPRKFLYGTYAARVKFSNTPVYGPDGDQVVQTFYTISPWFMQSSPDYGEMDFEYLANGGWGKQTSTMWNTTWENSWDRVTQDTAADLDGWHTCVIQCSPDAVKYYVDGKLYVVHTDPKYIPETPMFLSFNQWFIDGIWASGRDPRAYEEDVDWVYYVQDQIIDPSQAVANANFYRNNNLARKDTVPQPILPPTPAPAN